MISTTDASPSQPHRRDMFWGPARRNPEHPFHPLRTATADALDLRDDAAERPDDN